MLLTYDKVPAGALYADQYFRRDKNRCQYCGTLFTRNELSIDHVIPRSYGGKRPGKCGVRLLPVQ